VQGTKFGNRRWDYGIGFAGVVMRLFVYHLISPAFGASVLEAIVDSSTAIVIAKRRRPTMADKAHCLASLFSTGTPDDLR
jgi:hypothetical protein